MNSFYGGKPGNSFKIVQNFETIAAMKAAFQQGANYTDVHYDEYVIINTNGTSDQDNGKVFRRGYDLHNEYGGGEYVGQIKFNLTPPQDAMEAALASWLNSHGYELGIITSTEIDNIINTIT